MRILHLIDIPWWSGLASYAFDCVTAQASMGHALEVLCERKSLMEKRAREAGIETSTMGGRRPWNAPENFLKAGWRILRRKPGRIVSHTGSTHWIALFWGKLLGIPVIRVRAISQRVKPGLLNRWVYQKTDWVIAASERLAQECRENIGIPWNGKLRSFLPPVDNPAFSMPGPLKAKVPSAKRIGVLARLDPLKGHFDVLSAAARLIQRHPDLEVHIAGAEENLTWNEIVKRAADLGLKNARYHGFLKYDEIWDFMKSVRVGVIPSRGSEEVSRALLEWMAAGRPVVASRVGCIPEILKEKEGGFLFEPADAAKMAEEIGILMEDLPLAEKMGQYNLEMSSKKFAPAAFKSTWHQVLYA